MHLPLSYRHPAPSVRKPALEDARSKIIQKKRAKIGDVRDILAAKKKPADARYVITKNMSERLGKMAITADRRRRHAHPLPPDPYMLDALALDDLIPPLKYSPSKLSAKPHYAPRRSSGDEYMPRVHPRDLEYTPRPRGYVDYDAVEDTKPLSSRDASDYDLLFKDYMSRKTHGAEPAIPSLPVRRTAEDDVFDLYEAPSRDRRPLPPAPVSSSMRRFIPAEETHLSYEMRSRLEGSHSAPKSMGIFANPTKPLASGSSSQTGSKGFRVMVTNLHSSVTVWDIQELFGDIGGLISAEIVKPGVAEVVYKTVKDAEDAVEVYHNRQLDGLPMKCHLITPPPVPAVTKIHHSGLSSGSSSRKAPLELDLDTLHSALFTKRH